MDTLQLPGFNTLSVQLAQELYDPDGRLVSDPTLADSHQEFAEFILDLYDLDADSTGVLLPALVCDAVESGLDTEEVLIARADRHTDVDVLVVPSVRHLVEATKQQANHIFEIIGIKGFSEDKRTLYAADRIAQAAYDGKTRKTGEAYYQHPKRAAAMALYIFNQLEVENYEVDSDFKDAVICAALLHDATEETIRSCKYYNPDRPKGFSPLLVREIFNQTGNPHGQIVANSLRLMTHYAKRTWAPDYETYVKLGSADFIFDLVKTLDMGDNLLHPKPITDAMNDKAREKIENKRALYSKLIGTLAINSSQRSDNPHNRKWSPRFFEIFRGIRPDDIPAMERELSHYIYGEHAEPAFDATGNLRPGATVSELIFPAAA